MSPLGQMISDWLKTKPGVFKGATPEAAIKEAYHYAMARGVLGNAFHPTYTVEQFAEGLRIAGYVPRERASFGDRAGAHYGLNLPEG